MGAEFHPTFENYECQVLKPEKRSNGFMAVQIHYKVHPERQNPDFVKSVTQGMKQSDIDREWECHLTDSAGRLFPYDSLFDSDNRPILTAEYAMPIPGHRYVIGVDAAEGSGNPCCAVVLDLSTWDEVAHVHGRIEPRPFAMQLYSLGELYNWATIAVEDEKYGSIVLTKLEDAGYPALYFRTTKGKRVPGKRRQVKRKLGWSTNTRTKYKMITDLVDAITEGTLGISTLGTIFEMNAFIERPDGTLGGEGTSTDDRVVATAIALQIAIEKGPDISNVKENVEVVSNLKSMDTEALAAMINPGRLTEGIGVAISDSLMDPRRSREADYGLISQRVDW